MIERLLLATGLVLLGGAAYLFARGAHLRVIKQRLARAGQNGTPGLAEFQPGQPAVLYFTTPHCVPCYTVLKPMLQRLITELGNRFQVLEVDAELQPGAARYWNVLSVPTVFVLDPDGRPQHVHYGVVSQEVLRAQISDWLRPGGQAA